MTLRELKESAQSLPLSPGIYIMRDKDNRVIYVGKAKKLKNRVSQYFQNTESHSTKTRLMVSKVNRFEVIVAASEFEALVLECSLIKQYMPKYNILLKDDKGFPYIRLNMNDPYPALTMVNRVDNDGAGYYGPFGSRGVTGDIIQTVRSALRLPDCNKKFPRDIGKERPCLNYHMNQCAGWCRGNLSREQYRSAMEQAKQLLSGNYKTVSDDIKEKMLQAASDLNFELAAQLRDQLTAVESLGKKQTVTAGLSAEMDVIGYGKTSAKACFAVLHYQNGNLIDKDYEVFSATDDDASAVSALMKQYYLSRGYAPKNVLLPFPVDDAELFSQLLEENFKRKTLFAVPQRGEKVKLVEFAVRNAEEEAKRLTMEDEQRNATLLSLGKMLGISELSRIESYDISNISGTDMVGSCVVFCDGKPKKGEYKRFKLRDMSGQDDYAAMHQVLERRFRRFIEGDNGFENKPDLLLIDGGKEHAEIAVRVLSDLELEFPVFGMVKDDRHRTRALISPQGQEIRIDNNQAVFSLVGTIQEETHRFAIEHHRKLRSKRLRYSELDQISGIGDKRKQELLKVFKSIKGISEAELFELEQHLPRNAAMAVYNYFRQKEGEGR